MPLPAPISLHRFASRPAIGASDFGYELTGGTATIDDCVAAVRWADGWCPDAAEFVLIRSPDAVDATGLRRLAEAMAASHLGGRMRLVCRPADLSDGERVAELHRQGIGFLVGTDDARGLRSLAATGIQGLYVNLSSSPRPMAPASIERTRRLVGVARQLGLRTLAGQAAGRPDLDDALGLGFDYASAREGGFAPRSVRFSWQRKQA